MYTRVKRVKNSNGQFREYLLLVESQRINGKVQQKTIANLGRLDIIRQTNAADVLAEKLLEYTQTKRLMDMDQAQAEYSKEYGAIVILRRLWENLGLKEFFGQQLQQRKYHVDVQECLMAMVINRLMEPKSEYSTVQWLKGVYESRWENLDVQHFYRALDFLSEHKADLEKELFFRTTDLFNQQLDLVMFDTTSIKYWGEGEADILKHGYSKEKRSDLKQLIVGILMSKDGIPVGCEIFDGNMADVKSFIQVIEKLKVRYNIGRMVWVADRGMVSKHNIQKLNEFKQDYILGVRMRCLNKERRKEFLNPAGMFEVKENLYVKEVYVQGEGRYIVCYNPQEKEKIHNNRKYFKQHLNKKLATSSPKDWMVKNAYKKYVDFEGTIELNEKKLLEESQYDGYWVLLTNTQLTAQEVALYYKGLWQVEAGFKDLKNDLEVGPIYHFKQERIVAHIFICFLALLLKIALKKRIATVDSKASYREVFEAVRKIKAVKLTSGRHEIIFRTEFEDKAYVAFKALGVAPAPNIIFYNKGKNVVSRPEGSTHFSSTK